MFFFETFRGFLSNLGRKITTIQPKAQFISITFFQRYIFQIFNSIIYYDFVRTTCRMKRVKDNNKEIKKN